MYVLPRVGVCYKCNFLKCYPRTHADIYSGAIYVKSIFIISMSSEWIILCFLRIHLECNEYTITWNIPNDQIDILHLTQPTDLYTLKICAYLWQYLLVIHRENLWSICLLNRKSPLNIHSGDPLEQCLGLQCNTQYLFSYCGYPVSQLLLECSIQVPHTFPMAHQLDFLPQCLWAIKCNSRCFAVVLCLLTHSLSHVTEKLIPHTLLTQNTLRAFLSL